MISRIDSVLFDWRIAVSPNELFEEFHTDGGWAIYEPQPGRIILEREGRTTIVQLVPYVLRVSVISDPEPAADPSLSEAGAEALAATGEISFAARLQSAAIKAGTSSPSKHAKRRP